MWSSPFLFPFFVVFNENLKSSKRNYSNLVYIETMPSGKYFILLNNWGIKCSGDRTRAILDNCITRLQLYLWGTVTSGNKNSFYNQLSIREPVLRTNGTVPCLSTLFNGNRAHVLIPILYELLFHCTLPRNLWTVVYVPGRHDSKIVYFNLKTFWSDNELCVKLFHLSRCSKNTSICLKFEGSSNSFLESGEM